MSDPKWGNSIVGAMPIPGTLTDVVINHDLGPEPAAHGIILQAQQLTAAAPSGAAFSSVQQKADITFGGGVASAHFQCDWRGQFALVCQYVEIRALAFHTAMTDPDSYGIDPDVRYKHTAIVGFGGWHAAKPLTYTARQALIGEALTPLVLQVPAFARRLFPKLALYPGSAEDPGLATPALAMPPVYVDQVQIAFARGGAAPNFWSSAMRLTLDDVRDGIPIGDADYISLVTLTAEKLSVTPIFELAL